MTSGAERLSSRLLIALTYGSVALLLAGVGLMLSAGISPLDGGPGLDLSTLGSELLSAEAAGFLWLGLLAVIAAPISRVMLAGIAYGRRGDWSMVGVALGIIAIVVVGVATAVAGTV